MSKPRPSVERLCEEFVYDPETGVLTRRKSGKVAGCLDVDSGYVRVRVDNVLMRAHRVIFAMVTGKWPELDIDHEDRNRSNNRWLNLREANDEQNNANSVRSNAVGLKGVYRMKGKFQAQIQSCGHRINLGTYVTPEEAHAAYAAKAIELFGEFARAS